MSYQVEICANSLQSAINAEQGGANRVELCDNLWEGGTTPSHATIVLAKRHLNIPVFVLIRPRGGDFVYSELEFEIIKQDIIAAKSAGADGIVAGVLLPNGQVDFPRTSELVALSDGLPFTFHRAFDHIVDIEAGITDLVGCGVSRILTSGQSPTVAKGIENLKKIIDLASNQLIILPGGGVNRNNVSQLFDIGCREFHFSAKKLIQGLSEQKGMVPMNGSEVIPENLIYETDSKKVREVINVLDEKV